MTCTYSNPVTGSTTGSNSWASDSRKCIIYSRIFLRTFGQINAFFLLHDYNTNKQVTTTINNWLMNSNCHWLPILVCKPVKILDGHKKAETDFQCILLPSPWCTNSVTSTQCYNKQRKNKCNWLHDWVDLFLADFNKMAATRLISINMKNHLKCALENCFFLTSCSNP